MRIQPLRRSRVLFLQKVIATLHQCITELLSLITKAILLGSGILVEELGRAAAIIDCLCNFLASMAVLELPSKLLGQRNRTFARPAVFNIVGGRLVVTASVGLRIGVFCCSFFFGGPPASSSSFLLSSFFFELFGLVLVKSRESRKRHLPKKGIILMSMKEGLYQNPSAYELHRKPKLLPSRFLFSRTQL